MLKEEIIQELYNEGFFAVKILKAKNPSKAFQNFYLNWLKAKPKGVMDYLNNTSAKFSLEKIFPKTKSIIVGLFSYYSKENENFLKKGRYKIALYAWGADYHYALKQKFLKVLTKFNFPKEDFRIIVDSTPLNERYYGRVANLGFIGKNGLLIHKEVGSYFFIAVALLAQDLKGEKIHSVKVHEDIAHLCGKCNLCVKACPTGALNGDGTMKAELCLSYLTIENKQEELKFPKHTKRHRYIFGCDICQKVCPYNQKPLLHTDPILNAQKCVVDISRGDFSFSQKELKKTALSRAGKKFLSRNIAAVENLLRSTN